MCSLLGSIPSSFDGCMFGPSISMADVFFRMGLLLLHLAQTAALVLQESVHSCVPDNFCSARGQPCGSPYAVCWEQGNP